jgi:hypothetical protein
LAQSLPTRSKIEALDGAFRHGTMIARREEDMAGIRTTAMNVGPLTCAKNLIVALAPGTIDMPTTAAVIEHPKFGVVLWDTGINDAVADPARADDYWGKGLAAAFGTHNFTPPARS